MKVGLRDLSDRVASAARGAARGKRGASETQRRIAAAVTPLLEEAVLIGVDQAIVAVGFRNHAATNAIAARKRALLSREPA